MVGRGSRRVPRRIRDDTEFCAISVKLDLIECPRNNDPQVIQGLISLR
jgi:hypothetical protein